MKLVEVNFDGRRKTREVSRNTLAKEFSMPPRDLRPIFSLSQVATIFSRGNGVVMNLGFVKLLIGADKVLVSNLDNDEIEGIFLPGLIKRIKESTGKESFELVVFDYALNHKVNKMRSVIEDLEKHVSRLLKKISGERIQDKTFEDLLRLKKKISKFEIIVKENEGAALEVLEDDEELRELCLSDKNKRSKKMIEETVDEVESVLDSFAEQLEEMSYKIGEFKENIDDTQEVLTLKMNSRRNTIIRFDLIATLVTALFSLMAVITGLYGMNIKNNLEENHEAFWIVVMFLGVSLFVFLFVLATFLRRKKIL